MSGALVPSGQWCCPIGERQGLSTCCLDCALTSRAYSQAMRPRFFPWNPEHPCFAGDFEDVDPFDHDMSYQDTSQGDGLYFQQSGHMECERCNHTAEADGWFDDSGWN